MEKTRFTNLSVKNTQLAGWALLNLSNVILIIILSLGHLGILSAADFPLGVTIFNGLLFACCGLAAYLLMSRIAANVATRKVMKNVGIILFAGGLFSLSVDVYRLTSSISDIMYSFLNAGVFIIKTFPLLYLFGALVRNNPDCRRARIAINTMFIVSFVLMFLLPQIGIILFPGNMAMVSWVDIVSDLTFLGCTYALFTSDVFNGETSHEPAPKGAYRFWNKYIVWYLVTMFGSTFLLVAYEAMKA